MVQFLKELKEDFQKAIEELLIDGFSLDADEEEEEDEDEV